MHCSVLVLVVARIGQGREKWSPSLWAEVEEAGGYRTRVEVVVSSSVAVAGRIERRGGCMPRRPSGREGAQPEETEVAVERKNIMREARTDLSREVSSMYRHATVIRAYSTLTAEARHLRLIRHSRLSCSCVCTEWPSIRVLRRSSRRFLDIPRSL